jgi:hypothetical protein
MDNEQILILEHFGKQQLKKKEKRINRYFKCITLLCILIEIASVIPFLSCFIIYIDTGLFWTLIPKFIQLIRIILLVYTLFMKTPVYWLRGIRISHTIMLIKHWKIFPPLGLWLLIGFVDLLLFRVLTILIDFIVFLALDSIGTTQSLLYIATDLIYVLEFYLTLNILYYIGVVNNIYNHLVVVKKRGKS